MDVINNPNMELETPDWHREGGTLVADKGDTAKTLSKYNGMSLQDARAEFKHNHYRYESTMSGGENFYQSLHSYTPVHYYPSGEYGPSTSNKDLAIVYSVILAPIVGTMELGALATFGVGVGINSLSQYIANGGNAGDINIVEAGMSGIPAIGKIPYLSKVAPTLIGETVSYSANNFVKGEYPQIPNSLGKLGAQVGGGVVSFGFGKVTDNHLAGEKGGQLVGEFFKFQVETASNIAPNLIKD